MYELKKIGKVFTSKFVGTGPSSYKKKIIYWAAVSQRLRNTALAYPVHVHKPRVLKIKLSQPVSPAIL